MNKERMEHFEILEKILKNNVNYPFSGKDDEREVPDLETFVLKTLSNAEMEYNDDYFWREYPDFKEFLYTHHVDKIAYAVYIGDYM